MQLCNEERARELMARDKVDGVIAHRPINQYYLSNYWGVFNTAGGYDGAYFSLLSASETQTAALVVPAFELRRLETTGGTWMPNVFSYSTDSSEAQIAHFDDGTPRGENYVGWCAADDATDFTNLENAWLNTIDQHGTRMSPNGFWALARAVKNAGLEKATLLVDDPRVADWLAGCGMSDLTVIYNPSFFNEIRMIKTPDELAIMERAALINEQALIKAALGVNEGSRWDEAQRIFMTDVASNGARGVYLICGLGELPAGEIRQGEAVMLDGLSKYQRYHGDFGRCMVVGDASQKHRRYHQAICAGWEVAQDLMKPGIRYSELSAKVGAAVQKAGIKDFRDPVVHGLGLEHTDDPKPEGVLPQTKGDQILQANMVINIDLPHTEIGWGSVHMEDTVVITDSGFRRLSQASMDLIEVS